MNLSFVSLDTLKTQWPLDLLQASVLAHPARFLLGAYALAFWAFLMAWRAMRGRRRLASQMETMQAAVVSLERAEGRRAALSISQPLRETPAGS